MGWDTKVHKLLGHCTSESAFGGTITHIPAIGVPQDFKGIWSGVYVAVEPESGVQVMSSDPNVGVRLADLKTQPQKGDVIVRTRRLPTVETTRYTIRAVEPDGEGGATLVLEKVVCK